MLTCITCAKQTDEKGEEGRGGRGTPGTKESVKSLTTQIKDMASKFSSAYKQCKPCTSPSGFKRGDRSFPDFDSASEGFRYSYVQPASANSTPAWDFTSGGGHNQGGRSYSKFIAGDRTPEGRESVYTQSDVAIEEDGGEPKEWMAQVEPGVHITFVAQSNGGNDLKRIRFSREMFDKWQAQKWWGENYDRILELYNVQRFNRQALNTPSRSEDEPRDSAYTRVGSVLESPTTNLPMSKDWTPRNHYKPKSYYDSVGQGIYGTGSGSKADDTSSVDGSRVSTTSRDEYDDSVSISNASDLETEWVEQDEPGVYITIRQFADGSRELRRVRFSREKFGEVNAKLWWEQNRERIQAQYL